MKVYHSLDEFEQGEYCVATIGTFDGLHWDIRQSYDEFKPLQRTMEERAY